MRHLIAPALVCLALAGCQTTLNGNDITNNLSLACQSAQQLLALPATIGAAAGSKTALSAAKLSNKVGLYCNAAQIAAPVITTVLNDLNTQAAVLLGTGVANRS